jgi:phosphoribosyl 1,2-cyclic phosphate phosphodiesterase
MMQITFLGTGTSTGVPNICCDCEVCTSSDVRDQRLRSSLLICDQGRTILIDCGPDFRQQMLKYHVRSLNSILLTHEHYDHVGGLDDVRAFKKVDIFAENRVAETLLKTMHYSFAANKYPGVPDFNLHIIHEYESFVLGETHCMPLRLMHANLPVLGFRLGNMAYLTDLKIVPQETIPLLQNLDLLILGTLRFKPHFSHLMVGEALDIIQLLKPKRTYFTHIGHDMGKHADVEKQLPAHVALAYDGLTIETY